MVTFSADSKTAAEELLQNLFQEQLVADAQIVDSQYSRMYNKFNREHLSQGLIQIRMYTADNRVPELISYVKRNNPNMNQDMAADVMSTQLNSGSQEYIDWIKKQTTNELAEESSNL